MSQIDLMACAGSGKSPDRVPKWGDNHRRPCQVCGQSVEVFLRRMDWTTRHHLKLGDHSA